MKQSFQAYLTWGEKGEGAGHDLSAFTDEEHLSGNRKRLTQIRKKTGEMSGSFPALQSASLPLQSAPQVESPLSVETEAAIEAALESYETSAEANVEDEECTVIVHDTLAQAAAKMAEKIGRAITTEVESESFPPTAEMMAEANSPMSELFGPVHPSAVTLQLPVIDCTPPAPSNKSGLSGSFKRPNVGPQKMSHWFGAKANPEAWDSRVETGMKAYEKKSVRSYIDDQLQTYEDELQEGRSFVELENTKSLPAIPSFGSGEVRMIESSQKEGQKIRRLSTLRDSFKMIGCNDSEVSELETVSETSELETVSEISFSSEPTVASKFQATHEFTAPASEITGKSALVGMSEITGNFCVQKDGYAEYTIFHDSWNTQESEEGKTSIADLFNDMLTDSFSDLLAECYEAAKDFEESVETAEETIETDQPVISFLPEPAEETVVEDFADNFSVTLCDALSFCELKEADGVHVHEDICFDPKSFAAHTIDGEPIEAVCMFDASENVSFKGAENMRLELETMFSIDPLSQFDEIEIESVALIDDCETLEIAAVGGKPSRQKTKGVSRSKKNLTRKEKRSKKRAASASVAI